MCYRYADVLMFLGVARGRMTSMDITIRVQTRVPLSGYAGLNGGPGQPFVGWLGLLRVLSAAVGSGAPLPNSLRKLASGAQAELSEDVRDMRLDGSF